MAGAAIAAAAPVPLSAALVLASTQDEPPSEPPPGRACALCGDPDPALPWSLHTSLTNFSHTPLAALLSRLCGPPEDGARDACDSCAVLLNTVDQAEVRLARLLQAVELRRARPRQPPDAGGQQAHLVPIHTELILHSVPPVGVDGGHAASPAPVEVASVVAPASLPAGCDPVAVDVGVDTVEEIPTTAAVAAVASAHDDVDSHAGTDVDDPDCVADDDAPTVVADDVGSKALGRRRNERLTGQFANVNLTELTTVRRQLTCLLCGKRKSSAAALRLHYMHFHKERPYTCPSPGCGKKLAGKPQLEKHWGYHLKDKPFQCDQCPKRFAWLQRLEEHQHVHRGTKPYSCDQCSKQFRQRNSLQYHVRTHHEKRLPFVCAACGRPFPTRRQMVQHSRMHLEVRPYACTLCDKTFTLKSVLKTHLSCVHRDRQGCASSEPSAGPADVDAARNEAWMCAPPE